MKNRRMRLCLSLALALLPFFAMFHHAFFSHTTVKHVQAADEPPGGGFPCPPCQ